jgi:glyoxylase I family protein
MQRISGIGGFFFRSADPDKLAEWYLKNFGINVIPQDYDTEPWKQEAGFTAFAPFPKDTDYFGDPQKVWMLNFRVADLDAMVAQLRGNGVEVNVVAEEYPNGRFARLNDPEGNPIELWQPK